MSAKAQLSTFNNRPQFNVLGCHIGVLLAYSNED